MEHLKTKMEPDQCHVRVTVCGILQNTAVSKSVSQSVLCTINVFHGSASMDSW